MPRNVQALNRLAFTTNVMMSASAADEEEAAVDQATESPLANMRDATAEADYVVSEHLPGPLADKSREEVLAEIAAAGGQSHVQWMEWQEQYGDDGLNSNIVVPHIASERFAGTWLTEKVILSNPEDCVRIARTHTQKEPNFQMFMGDSVISAVDNNAWKEQRNHMTQAFLPMSSLAHIFPVSNQRAIDCADILKRLSQGGTQKINMSEFYLNETQQQLHLALFGESNEDFDENLNASFRDSLGGPPSTPTYDDRQQLYTERKQTDGPDGTTSFLGHLNTVIAKNSGEFAAPTDLAASGVDPTSGVARNPDGSVADKKIRGPLSAVLAEKLGGGANTFMEGFDQLDEKTQKRLNSMTDFGNAFIFAFAGHDTTGHTLTWLTYELAKRPEMQQRMVDEVDSFWEKFGDRPIGTGEPNSVEFVEFMKASPFMTKCITETLRLWPVVPNGTFRQLSHDDYVKGPGGERVKLPKGTFVQVTTVGRHRNSELWGDDVNEFNPDREWQDDELWHDQVYAARNPHSPRFSPFTHTPRDCIGKNFAQMEMRTILTQLFKNFTFELSPDEKEGVTSSIDRGMNNGTMGPIDVDYADKGDDSAGFGGIYGMHCYAIPRNAEAADWQTDMPSYWPKSRGGVPGIVGSSEPAPRAATEMAAAAGSGPPVGWPEMVREAREKGLKAPVIFPWSADREAQVRAALA
jgi:cytochrome P450